MKIKTIITSALLLLAATLAIANTPGVHSITLSWTEASCPSCVFNVYRGTQANVCSGNPTPYAKGVATTTYLDTAVQPGQTYVYAVSAVNGGLESSCSQELQISMPSAPATPTGLQGQVN
jgi:fibronectin type 3 domain-containing protein